MYATCVALSWANLDDGNTWNCRNYADVIGCSLLGGWYRRPDEQRAVWSGLLQCRKYHNQLRQCRRYFRHYRREQSRTVSRHRRYSCHHSACHQLQQAAAASPVASQEVPAGSFINCVNYGNVSYDLQQCRRYVPVRSRHQRSRLGQDDLLRCFNFGNVYCGNKATLVDYCGSGKGTKDIAGVYYDVPRWIGLKAGAKTH